MRFEEDPSADPVFRSAFPHLADFDWASVGPTGIGNDETDAPCDPVFRYGRNVDGSFLSVHFGQAAYRRRGDARIVWMDQSPPETLLAAMPGRALGDVVTIPGLEGWIIGSATPARAGGVDLTIVPPGERTCSPECT